MGFSEVSTQRSYGYLTALHKQNSDGKYQNARNKSFSYGAGHHRLRHGI